MYNIKIYDQDGTTWKKNLELSSFESISDFSARAGGGLGDVQISMTYDINDSSIKNRDFVEVYFKKQLIYKGYILKIKKRYSSDEQKVTLDCVGLGSLFTNMRSGTSYTSVPISDIVKDIVDQLNGEYGHNIFYYDSDSIPTETAPASFDFSDYPTYFEKMNEVAVRFNRTFFVDRSGKVFFRQREDFQVHKLKLSKHIQFMDIEEDSQDVINKIVIRHGGGLNFYSDSDSIDEYNTNEEYEDKTNSIGNATDAESYANDLFDRQANEFKKVVIIVNNEYNFFDINPGDLITILNSKYQVNDSQVVKITYGAETARIELERSYSLAEEIFNG